MRGRASRGHSNPRDGNMIKSKQMLAALALVAAAAAQAAGTTYNSRSAFEATLGASVTDDYENPAYHSNSTLTVFSDADMSAVLNETRYHSITFPSNNMVWKSATHYQYCAGCNGEYSMDFTSTSVGTSQGVFGVGFDVLLNAPSDAKGLPMHALVQYGDGASEEFQLPLHQWAGETNSYFFGLTSKSLIRSISILNTGGSVGNFSHDNLTIGAAAVPEPSAVLMSGAGALVLAFVLKRARHKA